MDESDVSSLLNVKTFHEDCLDSTKQQLYFGQEISSFDEYIKSKMGVSHDMVEELSSVTG